MEFIYGKGKAQRNEMNIFFFIVSEKNLISLIFRYYLVAVLLLNIFKHTTTIKVNTKPRQTGQTINRDDGYGIIDVYLVLRISERYIIHIFMSNNHL